MRSYRSSVLVSAAAICFNDSLLVAASSGLTASAAAQSFPAPSVDCGGHFAETCSVCPQGHHYLWCHGDCSWVFGQCEYSTPWVSFQKFINDVIDAYLRYLYEFTMHLPFVLLFGLIMGIYAVIYKGKVVDEYPEDFIEEREADYDDFSDERPYGLFAVFREPSTCLWAFFCTPVLAAKNFTVGKSYGYWPSCIIMFFMYTPLFCIAVIMRAVMSNALLRNLRIRPSFCEQFCTGLFCMPCAIGRESLEVDNATYMEAKCLFKAESTWEEHNLIEEIVIKERECVDRMCGGGTGRLFGDHKGWFHKNDDHHEEHHHEERNRSCGGEPHHEGHSRTCGS